MSKEKVLEELRLKSEYYLKEAQSGALSALLKTDEDERFAIETTSMRDHIRHKAIQEAIGIVEYHLK